MEAYADALYSYAVFAETNVTAYKGRRTEMKRIRDYRQRRLEEISRLEGDPVSSSSSIDFSRSRESAEKGAQIDREQFDTFTRDGNFFLTAALHHFCKVLEVSDAHNDDAVLRLCALWLEHHYDANLNKRLLPLLTRIPSYKFVFLSHQLTARLTKTNGSCRDFQAALHSLVVRVCTDHPFHSLYQVLSLRQSSPSPSNESPRHARRGSFGPSRGTPDSQGMRNDIANEIIDKVRRNPRLRARVQKLEHAYAIFVEFAEFDATNTNESKRRLVRQDIPKQCRIRSLSSPDLPVATVNLPLDYTCIYDPANMPCIQSYTTKYMVLGGINAPKVVQCHGTDGSLHKQLVRSNIIITSYC